MSSQSGSSRSESRSSSSSSSSSRHKRRNYRDTKLKENVDNNKENKDNNKVRIKVERVGKDFNTNHLQEIFSNFSDKLNVEFPKDDKVYAKNRFAYIDFYSKKDAEEAILYMNGGQINGVEIVVKKVDIEEEKNERK